MTAAKSLNLTGKPVRAAAPESGPAPRAQEPRIVVEHADVLALPLPPLHWICERLRLAKESVSMFAGYGYSKKTMTLQAAALAHASGRPLFGLLNMTRGRALHVDYEQGSRLTRERYQRMARAQGIDLAALGNALGVATFPRLRLSDLDAEDELTRVLDGYTFAVFDSLRAGAPDVEENSSEIRSVIDAAARAGKKVGCAVAIIHHARKPSPDANSGKFQIRGSSAIFDACDEVWIFEAEKGEATKVSHEKDRLTGVEVEDFYLDVADVTGPNGDPRWGLEVKHVDREEMSEHASARDSAAAAKAEAERSDAIQTTLMGLPAATWTGPRSSLAKYVGGRYQATLAAIDGLISTGKIEHAKDRKTGEVLRWIG